MVERRLNEEIFHTLTDQAETSATSAGGRQGIPQWLCKNTMSPISPQHNWGFESHEYQIGILEDDSSHVVVMKAAQVGLSELSVRLALALAAKIPAINLIYTLPSTTFARKFVTSRVDPVIKNSKRLKSLVPTTVNSTELKRVGSSHMFFGGCQVESQAISIPARALINDEQSFSDPKVLSVYKSRLGHNLEGQSILVEFSTPLYPDQGIDIPYQEGSQNQYLCFHDRCGQWVMVDYLEDLVLPGFDDIMLNIAPDDLNDPRVKVSEAYLKCSHCGSKLSQENLADPTKRAWVPKFPDRDISSYLVQPDAASRYRTPAKVIGDLSLYRSTAKWIQYGIGLPYSDAEATIVEGALERAFTVPKIPPEVSTTYRTVMGVDIGHVSHAWYGARVNGVLEVFWGEKIKQDGTNVLGNTLVDRVKKYRVVSGVIDAMPDVSIVSFMHEKTVYNTIWGAFFIRQTGHAAATLAEYEQDEEKGLVKIRRTAMIDYFVKEFNAGKIRLPMGMSNEEEVKEHLRRPKRIINYDNTGEEVATWVSSGQDHFAFALIYLTVAAKMLEEDSNVVMLPGAGHIVSKVKMRS